MSIVENQPEHIRENPLLAAQVDLGAVLKDGINPPDELEPDVLLKGMIHHIFGPSESGKTIIGLWAIKRRIEDHQRVVVFDAENGTRTIAERLKQMGADPDLVDEYLVYLPFPDLTMDARTKAAFADLLDEIEPMLVVFDSWASFLATGGLSENENADVEAWDTAFTKVAKMKGIASAIIDHTPHEHDRSRGAARKREVADVQWFVKKTKDFNRDVVGESVLINKKDREGWLPGSVKFSIGGSFGRLICERSEGTIETADPIYGLTPSERKVFDTLREEFPNGARAGEWQRAADGRGVSRSAHYRAVSKLVSDTPLVSKANETYFANESPNPGKGGGTKETRIHKPNVAKSHLVPNGSNGTNGTEVGGEVSSVSPPYKGGDVGLHPETSEQRHSQTEPEPERRIAARDGMENSPLASPDLADKSDTEQVQPENDACGNGDDHIRDQGEVFDMARERGLFSLDGAS